MIYNLKIILFNSFAIRIDNAREIITQMLQKGKVARPWLGLKMISLTPYILKQLEHEGEMQRIPLAQEGVLISEVLPNSPATKAGCLPRDIIVAVDDVPVETTQEVLKILGLRVHEPIKLKLKRRQILEQDWDGRVMRFEDEPVELLVKTEDLESFLSRFSKN